MKMNHQGPGLYRHYKGGIYRVLGLAKHESELYMLVIYQSPADPIHMWARPLEDFNQTVEVDGINVARFVRE